MAVAGEPAAQVFAIDGFEVGDAGGAHAETETMNLLRGA